MKRMIVIASGKGGVGKTTTAINLGAAINQFGFDVLIIDANMSTPNIGIHLNSPEVPISLNDVINNKAYPYEAVYVHPTGLKVLPSSLSIKELKKLKIEKLKDFKKDFKKLAQVVIIDCAAGLNNDATAIMELADEIILVTNPEMPALTDALKTIKVAQIMKKPVTGVIVTRVRKDDAELDPGAVKEMLETPVLGMIPEERKVQKSLRKRDALVHLYPKSNGARAYKEIAAKLMDHEYDSNEDKEGIIDKILNFFEKYK